MRSDPPTGALLPPELDPNPPRNARLEARIAELADLLAGAHASLVTPGARPRLPVVLVVGPPRSGTTLMMQWLAASGAFAYPTNLLARFSAVPAVGARIQQLLCDPAYAWASQLDVPTPVGFDSALGKTAGTLGPNEFWWFWRRFLPTVALRHLGAQVADVDAEGLNAELAALQDVFGQPLAMKGMILQHDATAFSALLPSVVWVWMHRDPVANARSLLGARARYHGDRAAWYSVEPRGAAALRSLDPVAQVTGQIFLTHRDLRDGLADLDPTRVLRVSYEGFCADPASVWHELSARLAARGHEVGGEPPATPFDVRSRPGEEAPRVRALWDEHVQRHGEVLP